MITFDEAKKKAKKLYPAIDNYSEYEDAYIFNDSNYLGFGGEVPIVILKASGRAISMTQYLDETEDRGGAIRQCVKL